MPLVGDVICRVRNIAGDPCQVLAAPAAPTGAASATAGIFVSTTVYGYITYLTSWGESLPSTEIGPFNCATKAIDLSAMAPPAAAISGRFYYGFASGAEQQYVVFAVGATRTVGTVGTTIVSATAPYRPSAYLPDTDGDLVSAFEIYRWLNSGLAELGRLAGGMLDQTGVAMTNISIDVVIPGFWLSIEYVWHNGWQALATSPSGVWLQGFMQGTPAVTTMWKNASQQVLGLWPQNQVTAASSTLSAPLAATDTILALTAITGFTAPGLCTIDNEILSFSQVPATGLWYLVRGYGGTVAASHLSGATVTQCTLRLLGHRLPVVLLQGSSANTLDVPPGWDTVLDFYLLSMFKQTEQDVDAAAKLMQQFTGMAQALREQPNEDGAQPPLKSKDANEGLYPIGGTQMRRPMPNTWVRTRQREGQPQGMRRRG